MKREDEKFRQRVISYLAALGPEEMALVSRVVNEERNARENKAKPRERGSLMIVLKEGHQGLETVAARAHVRNTLVSTNVADTETADTIIKNRWPVLEHLTQKDALEMFEVLCKTWNPCKTWNSWQPTPNFPFQIVPQIY